MSERDELIHRRGIFLRTFELEGFCQGLSQALAVGQSPGPVTKAYFALLIRGARSILVGPAKDDIPDTGADPSPADMLVVASVLKNLLTAFLTPDEREQHDCTRHWGLAPRTQQDRP